MKVLINSYNTVCQNQSGGIQVRIKNYLNHIVKYADVKLFDMWKDKVSDYDVVHFFKAHSDSYSLMCMAKDMGKKIVLSSTIPQEKSSHITYNLIFSRLLRMHTGYKMLKEELDMADCIISQTEKEKKFIEKYYRISGRKIVVIPNGISINFNEEYRSLMKNQYQLTDKYILQVGRFDSNKNQLSVIRALKGTGLKVVFIGGEDPQFKEYYQQCIKEADDNFLFLGWQDHSSPTMQSAYMNAHVVVLPSHNEIFGNSLVEGGAAGANLVATRELPLHSMGISEYCSVIDPNNLDDIRNKLVEAMRKDKNLRLQREIAQKFSWDEVAQKYYSVYERVLN